MNQFWCNKEQLKGGVVWVHLYIMCMFKLYKTIAAGWQIKVRH